MDSHNHLDLLTAARDAWLAAGRFRGRRDRHKRYAYGDQWCDLIADKDGHYVTERDMITKGGRLPLTNNMIRQIIKIVIGRYRTACKEQGAYSSEGSSGTDYVADNALFELDCRMLEEFLISGCAIQRVSRESRRGRRQLWIDNVDPRMFFVNAFKDPRGHDIEMLGMLHDLTFPEIVARFGGDSHKRAEELAHIYTVSADERPQTSTDSLGETDSAADDFFTAPKGRCRAIEVWSLDCRTTLVCHDRMGGRAFRVADSAGARRTIDGLNSERQRSGEAKVRTRRKIDFVWHCRWFAPDGSLLASYDSPYRHGSHPFALKFYPLTDGEVHSFVEDVIDQQRCVNRMVVLMDHIIATSAKGVLLFPIDQKPRNMEWNDVIEQWSSANGVIPVTGHGNALPQQVSTNNGDAGAYQLLALQMKLFDQISGVGDVIAGRNVSPSTGKELYENQLRNSTIALEDMLASFAAFRSERDRKAQNI